MSKIGIELPKEYSDRFDKLRQNRVEVSFYKYGTAADNFGMKLVDALESHDMCIKKNIKKLETQNIFAMQQIISCLNLCIRRFRMHFSKQQTAERVPELPEHQ